MLCPHIAVEKSLPRLPDPISNAGIKPSPRQSTCDWYLPRTSSRFLNSVGKIESGGITGLVSGKLRTAPKRCFPFPAARHPPSIYLIYIPITACPSSIFSNPDSTNHICPSLILSTKAIHPPPCPAATLNHGQATFRLLRQGRNHQAEIFALGKRGSGMGQKHQDWESGFLLLLQSYKARVMTDAAEEGLPPTKMQPDPPSVAEGCVKEK